jgi:hypothetical protein
MPLHAALGAIPIRERSSGQGDPFVIPVGECPFAIGVTPTGFFSSTTQFSDGRTVTTDHAVPILTNLETGATYVQHTNVTFTDTLTADGDIFEVLDGRYWFGFFPGDQGPDGVVGDAGAGFILVGHFEYIFDADTFAITSFQGSGLATNECQLLGP